MKEVAHLGSRKHRRALAVLLCHEGVPDGRLRGTSSRPYTSFSQDNTSKGAGTDVSKRLGEAPCNVRLGAFRHPA